MTDGRAVARPLRAHPTFRLRSIAHSTWRIYRADLRLLIGLAALLEGPLVLLELGLHVTPSLQALVDGGELVPAVAVAILYASLSHHLLAGLLERVVATDLHRSPRPSTREVLHDLPWATLLAADVLVAALTLMGLALFVIPGLVVMAWLAPVLPIVNMERRTVRSAVWRSIGLVRGHAWRVGAIALATFLLPEVVGGVAAALAHGSHPIAVTFAHAIPVVLVLPLAALPLVITTFDLINLEQTRDRRGPSNLPEDRTRPATLA